MRPTPKVLPLALTMGDPAGIGAEIAIKAWLARDCGLPPFFLIADVNWLHAEATRLKLAVSLTEIGTPEDAPAIFAKSLPILPLRLSFPVYPGKPDPRNAMTVLDSIRLAVELAQAGRAGAVVTNPIAKSVLAKAGFSYPGHTEFLSALCGDVPVEMMLTGADLRVVPVTIHMSLRKVLQNLSTERIIACARLTAKALRQDFAIPNPRIAVSGLNPHAGEDGVMGTEDQDIIAPAVAALRAEEIDAFGPLPADTLFHARARQGYDVALCMFHDQALIPLKTLAFDTGVNVTLGLPIIRTSPDHGTAFAIAGTGAANPDSLIAALKLAGELAERRRHG